MLGWLLKGPLRTVLRPGSRGGTGYTTGGGGWRYGRRATPTPSGTAPTPSVDQAREVAQRLWGTDLDAREHDGRCQIVRRIDGGGEVVLADAASWPEALTAAKAAHQRPEDRPAVALAKAATKGPLLRFAKPPDADGAYQLGTTKRGKPVHASGAETRGYDDDDHLEAAALHHRTALHHAARAEAHRDASGAEQDSWQRSEMHHQESERHERLADHHHELARDHLVAGGRGSSQALTLGKNGALEAGAVTPHDAAARKAAEDRFAGRTHWGHPGGMTPGDRHAYAGFGEAAPRRMAKGGGMLIFHMRETRHGLVVKSGGEGSRGGKVVGHTRSGKPIYFHGGGQPGTTGTTVGKVAASHAAFTPDDHRDASALHRRMSDGADGAAHADHMLAHDAAVAQKRADGPSRRGAGAADVIGHTKSGKPVPANLEPAHAYRAGAFHGWSASDHEEASALHEEAKRAAPAGAEVRVTHGTLEDARQQVKPAIDHHGGSASYHRSAASAVRRETAGAAPVPASAQGSLFKALVRCARTATAAPAKRAAA